MWKIKNPKLKNFEKSQNFQNLKIFKIQKFSKSEKKKSQEKNLKIFFHHRKKNLTNFFCRRKKNLEKKILRDFENFRFSILRFSIFDFWDFENFEFGNFWILVEIFSICYHLQTQIKKLIHTGLFLIFFSNSRMLWSFIKVYTSHMRSPSSIFKKTPESRRISVFSVKIVIYLY